MSLTASNNATSERILVVLTERITAFKERCATSEQILTAVTMSCIWQADFTSWVGRRLGRREYLMP